MLSCLLKFFNFENFDNVTHYVRFSFSKADNSLSSVLLLVQAKEPLTLYQEENLM